MTRAMAAKKSATVRAFVALDLDPMSLRRVVRVADRLRMGSGAPSATWVPGPKMHVTLRFMGALPESAIAPLAKGLGALCDGKAAPKPCALRLAAFPTVEDAEIVVVELDDTSGGVIKLAEKIDKLATKLGIAGDARPFRPHVTLARLKRAYDSRRWLRQELVDGAGECRAERVTLYRSVPAPEGATYTPLARFAFAPPPAR
ncbi:MAG TPA: RNA 2',3'-cyclic phosphodiesterase [Polyangiaceae bacterium]|nr:RNA 2',3'-cyclic phosphodiesterase [Polyangiaceae bacterium]